MKFDAVTEMPNKIKFYDFTRSFYDKDGKRSFEPLRLGGNPNTAHNIHLIKSHSQVSGIVKLDAVCSSSMGLSIPVGFEVLIVNPPPQYGVSVKDVFEHTDYGMPDDCTTGDEGGIIPEDDLTRVLGELEASNNCIVIYRKIL